MTTSYADFLARKQRGSGHYGRDCQPADVHPMLHDWQREIVLWAVRKGRAALWEDTGLGKTIQQLEWARLSGDRALIVAPLAVCHQTVREAAKLGISARYAREDDGLTGVIVTNYEMADRFDPATLDAVVLDEASILKQSDGKTRTKLIGHFAAVPARLACTATPAPNDPEELTNQAEFLGVMPRVEMLAAYFVHDDQGWRLKGHAREPMYRWMTSWAVALRRPSDIGYPDAGYDLPALDIVPELVDVEIEAPEGQLFAAELGGVSGRAQIRKETLLPRCERVVELVNASHELTEMKGNVGTWDGSPSTPLIDAPNTNPIPKSASGENPKGDPPTPTGSTCASTTATTRRGFSSTSATRPSSETLGDANGTPATPSTEPSASVSRSSETRSQSGTTDSARRSESPRLSTTSSLNSRVGVAQSVELRSATGQDDASPSITATTVGVSAASCAGHATSGSASSATTPSSFPQQSITCSAKPEPWVIWCGLNDEQTYLEKAFGDRCLSLTGSQTPEQKVETLYRWLDGERPILLTKVSIAGMGINMQHCARMAFVGLGDSFEQYYQAIRRCWRYGQTRPVRAHVVLSALEGQIASNVARKERDTNHLIDGLVTAMHQQWRTAA